MRNGNKLNSSSESSKDQVNLEKEDTQDHDKYSRK